MHNDYIERITICNQGPLGDVSLFITWSVAVPTAHHLGPHWPVRSTRMLASSGRVSTCPSLAVPMIAARRVTQLMTSQAASAREALETLHGLLSSLGHCASPVCATFDGCMLLCASGSVFLTCKGQFHRDHIGGKHPRREACFCRKGGGKASGSCGRLSRISRLVVLDPRPLSCFHQLARLRGRITYNRLSSAGMVRVLPMGAGPTRPRYSSHRLFHNSMVCHRPLLV